MLTHLPFFLRGLLIGLAIAMPVGPIGLLAIQRTLEGGRLVGFVSGLGAATADTFYGAVAALGLTMVSGVLIAQRPLIQGVGGLFLVFLGIRAAFFHASFRPAPSPSGSLAWSYLSVFFLTLANPMTIVSFVAVFSSLGLGRAGVGFGGSAWMVLGVFLGSGAWWLTLSTGVSLVKRALTPGAILWIGRGAGALMAAFGLLGLFTALF